MSDFLPALPEPGAAISAGTVADLERQVAENVSAVEDIGSAEEWRAQAAALEAYLRSKGLHGPMLGAQRRIEARIGQLLGDAKRGRPTNPPHAEDIRRDGDRADFRLLGRALASGKLTPDEWRHSRRKLVSIARGHLGEKPKTPPFPEGTFPCVVADPPWQLTTGATMPGKFGDTAIKLGGDSLTYDQMTVADIAALPVKPAPDAHLYLWTVNRYIEDAYAIARAWGFDPSALLTWTKKQMGVGLGGTFRQTTEFILFARRGKLSAERIVETTWFDWPRGRHSVKPDAFYELVESVTTGPRLDMFARRERDGWESWGDEVADAA